MFSSLPWSTSASGIAYLAAGNVGIGTATPQGKLDVAAGDGAYIRVDPSWGDLHANGGNDGYFGIFNDGPASGRTDFLSQGATRMSITNGGDVGIGTTSPWTRLMVVRNDSGHGFWSFSQSTANDANSGAAGSPVACGAAPGASSTMNRPTTTWRLCGADQP